MRVLYLTDPLSDLDGVGRYAVRLIAALEAVAPELRVEVLLARKHRPTSSAVPAHWRVRVALPPDYFYYLGRGRSLAEHALGVLRAYPGARRADLVHAIKDYPHSRIALAAARLAGVPCVATGHGTYTVQPLLAERHRRTARATYAGFARLIAVSQFTRGRLLELLDGAPPSPERVVVIPNAVRAAHYEAPRAVGPQPWHAWPYTLAMGETKERKGHHLSLAAFCRVAATRPELHHVLVGRRSQDDYERSLHALVAAAGLTARVHFLGNVEEDLKIDLLQRAEVFVHTPVTAADGGFEGFGLVYLEAGASGTVSIGTLGCGAQDALVHGVTGLLVAPGVDEVATALAQLLDEPSTRRRMGAAARAHAQATSWEDNARRVLALYREVLA
jgi:phosphatidyl-myo-inositol dimannoside synthase